MEKERREEREEREYRWWSGCRMGGGTEAKEKKRMYHPPVTSRCSVEVAGQRGCGKKIAGQSGVRER